MIIITLVVSVMKRLILIGFLITVILSVSVGCSSKSAPHQVAPATTAPALQYSYDRDNYSNSSKGGFVVPTPTVTLPKNAGASQATQTPISTWANVGNPQVPLTDRMVVRNANIQMVVSEIAATLNNIPQIAANYGGYVVNSQKWKEGDRNIGNVSIRILAENFDKAMADIRTQAKSITSESTSSQDVTEEYIDLDSQVKNLEATETQLLKVMETAIKTEDILSIQRELTSVRGEIEQAKGRMQYLERTSSTSLIDIRLEEAVIGVKFTAAKISMGTDEPVQFTSEVVGGFSPYNYFWDFGDGKTSNDASPSHAYSDSGNYSVYLKVTDDKGYSNTMIRNGYINVVASWKPASVAAGAWNGFAAFGRALVNVLIWLGIFSPVWLVIGGIIWIIVWRRKKKSSYINTDKIGS